MSKVKYLAFTCIILLIAGSVAAQEPDLAQLQQQVADTERAFAKTMADRDHDAFTSFLSDETIFFAGETPQRGKQKVADAWAPYFEGPDAPFSWAPETVVVLDSGTLAHSSGPVLNSEGKRVATYNSIWRREADGRWQIVFDKGSNACNCPAQADAD
jgi:ketosteroid isomerase-like protein